MAADRFERNAHTFTILTLVSRVTGLLRDATLARAFGVGAVMDAFSFGFMVPNLFRRLFGEGALSASFLPIYTRSLREDPERARRFASLLVVLMAVVLNGIVVVAEVGLFAARAMTGAGPTPDGELERLGLTLLMIMLPYMPLVCMVAVLGSVLQVHDRFGPPAASPIIMNVVIVSAAIGALPIFAGSGVAGQSHHAIVVGCSVLLAGAFQLAWMAWGARRYGLSLAAARGAGAEIWAPIRETLAKALPMMVGLGVLQLNTFLDGLIASYPTLVGPTIFGHPFPLEEGAMAALGNAQRLYEFPLGVFGIAVASAIFPVLARQAHEPDAFVATLRRGLRLVFYIGLPASVGLMLVARPIVATILQGGRFTPDDSARVAFILLGYAPAIWSYSAVNVFTRAFYASGDPTTPTRVAGGMVALNLLLNVTLIWTPLREAGLAWSTATCSVVQCAILARILRGRVGRIADREVWRSCAATALATAAMTAALVATRFVLPDSDSWGAAGAQLAALVVLGGAAFIGASLLLRRPELRWALAGRR